MQNPISYKDRNGVYLKVNKIFATQIAGLPEEQIIGYTLPEIAWKAAEKFPERAYINEIFLPDHVGKWDKEDFELLKNGGTSTHEYKGVCADGIKRTFLINKSTFNSDKGEITGLITILQDITELKKSESVLKENLESQNKLNEQLQKSEETYRSLIENFKGIVFQADENFIPRFLHGAVKEITGYNKEEFTSSELRWIDIVDPECLPIICENRRKLRGLSDYRVLEVEYRIISRNGEIKWVHEICQKISGTAGGHTYQCVIYDITKRKETEKILANLEAARKKEIHHRIKNNLQVIYSLLDLQAEKFSNRECIQNSEILEAFRESQDRVMSIALIHKELYAGEGNDALNFSLYLQRLVKNLFQTYRVGNTDISLKMDIEENIFFDTDIAVPLGMIVNELVSNSLKYAFKNKDKDKGKLQVKLSSQEIESELIDELSGSKNEPAGRRYTLKVSDNGSGIPETIGLKNPNTLGLQLVRVLVDQLEGKIKLSKGKGTAFTINFSIADNTDSVFYPLQFFV